MELRDAKDAPLFRIRLVAETLLMPFVPVHLASRLGEAVSLV